jgi:hypothetical protein
MVYKRYLVFMLITIVPLVTGCVNCTISIKEYHDESADIRYQLSISEVATRLISDQGINPIEDLKQLAVLNGFTVKDLIKNNAIGYTAERHVESVKEIPNLLSVLGLDNADNSTPITINRSLLHHQLSLDTDIDLSGIYGQPGSAEEQLAKTLIKDANIKLMYTTNNPPLNHNCDSVISNGDTKTYVWKINLGEQNKITLTTKSLQTGSVAALALLVAILGYCVGMYIYLGKKEQQQQTATDVNEEKIYMNSTLL